MGDIWLDICGVAGSRRSLPGGCASEIRTFSPPIRAGLSTFPFGSSEQPSTMALSKAFMFFVLIFLCNGVTLVRSAKKRPVLNVRGEATVTANLGDTVTLPCGFQVDGGIEVSRLIVHWSKDGENKYFANKTCCDLKGDYEITEHDLKNGRAPLQLRNVQEEDAGVYTCAIKYEDMEGSADTIFNIHGMQGRPDPQTFPADDSIVPEAESQYRTLKFGLVTGVVAVSGILAVSLFICFKG